VWEMGTRMRILMSSHVFAPSVGGLETVSQTLAEEFVRIGHDVRVITQTPGQETYEHPFELVRRPSVRQLVRLLRWCDIYFQNNISLQQAWPLLVVRRPWVVAHHVWIPRRRLSGHCKRIALRFATGVSISAAIARDISAPSRVIPNPYDEAIFHELTDVERTRDIVFLGRLVSDKGVDVLVAALGRLRVRGMRPLATIVGEGPEEVSLRKQVAELGLEETVHFAGCVTGPRLARVLNAHRVIAIPSRWREPFGVVALEGMACGCVPVGSAEGGLCDAIGECGETFPNGDFAALASVLEGLLRDPQRQAALRTRARAHLGRHVPARVAQDYLRIFNLALASRGRRGVRSRSD
jgi:glycogen(starch) synthase